MEDIANCHRPPKSTLWTRISRFLIVPVSRHGFEVVDLVVMVLGLFQVTETGVVIEWLSE